MHTVILGIEHLMTGVQVRSGVLTFHRESSSIVRVASNEPIECYWPVKQTWVKSAESPDVEVHYSIGETQYIAQVIAPAMVRADYAPPNLPYPIIRAMRAKFGAQADHWIRELKYDTLNGIWYFTRAGIFHGVEPDGYIHT